MVVLAVNQYPVAFVPDRRSRMPRATHCEITELRNPGVVALAPAGIVVVSTEESGSLTRCSDQKSQRLWSFLSELLANPLDRILHRAPVATEPLGNLAVVREPFYLAPRGQGSAAAAGRADRGPSHVARQEAQVSTQFCPAAEDMFFVRRAATGTAGRAPLLFRAYRSVSPLSGNAPNRGRGA